MPLVVRGPGIAAGRVVSEPVSLVDIPRMVLEGVATPAPKALYFESYYGNLHFGWAPLRGIREGSMKLIVAPRPELYDLDPTPARRGTFRRRERTSPGGCTRSFEKVSEKKTRGGRGLWVPATSNGSRAWATSGPGRARRPARIPRMRFAKLTDFGRKLREAITRFDRGELSRRSSSSRSSPRGDILSFEVHLYLARCHRLDGKLAEAIREYEAAAVIYDGYSVLHLEHGRALLASSNFAGAAAAFEKSLAIAAFGRSRGRARDRREKAR